MAIKFPKLPADSILLKKVLHPAPFPVLVSKPSGCVRVVTFNVHFGKNLAKIVKAFAFNPNLAIADIIFFQEIENRRSQNKSQTKQLARALGLNFIYVPSRALSMGRGTHGLAVLSRFPLSGTEAIKLPVYKLLRMRPRIAIASEVEVFGEKVKIYNVHLNGPLNYSERIKQLQTVIDHLKMGKSGQPVILGGDFNTIPLITLANTMIPIFYHNQKRKFNSFLRKNGFQTNCEKAGHTMRRGLVMFQLDGIYPKNARVANFGVERSVKVSDHYPLWADIKIV